MAHCQTTMEELCAAVNTNNWPLWSCGHTEQYTVWHRGCLCVIYMLGGWHMWISTLIYAKLPLESPANFDKFYICYCFLGHCHLFSVDLYIYIAHRCTDTDTSLLLWCFEFDCITKASISNSVLTYGLNTTYNLLLACTASNCHLCLLLYCTKE